MLKCEVNNIPEVTIFPPENKTWDDVYEIQLMASHKQVGDNKAFNLGIYIPVRAMWKSKELMTSEGWFAISMPQPYLDVVCVLSVHIDDEKITINTQKSRSLNSESSKNVYRFDEVFCALER